MIKITPPVQYGKVDAHTLRENIVGHEVAVICSNTVWTKSYVKDEISSLEDKNVAVFRHMRPNAPFADLKTVVDHYGGKRPDTIIAIGGGSILDAAKALSVAFEGRSISDLFYKRVKLPSESIHVVAVPTTAGTGAELSFGSIIYDDVNNIKGGIRGEVLQPNAVLLDVELYKTAPKRLLSEVGFDCLTHAVETYLSVKSDPLTRFQSTMAIKTVFDHLPSAVTGDTRALEKMVIASAMMGINLAYSSTCLPHRIQYVIGPMTGTSHAQGLIALYTGWLSIVSEDKSKSGVDELEKELGGTYDLYDRVEMLKQELDICYSLSSLGIKEGQLQSISSSVKGSVENDPTYKNIQTINKILTKSL